MEFSNAADIAASSASAGCKWSHDGLKIAHVSNGNIIIREVTHLITSELYILNLFYQRETMKITKSFPCADAAQRIEWSTDDSLILCTLPKIGVVQVLKLFLVSFISLIKYSGLGHFNKLVR